MCALRYFLTIVMAMLCVGMATAAPHGTTVIAGGGGVQVEHRGGGLRHGNTVIVGGGLGGQGFAGAFGGVGIGNGGAVVVQQSGGLFRRRSTVIVAGGGGVSGAAFIAPQQIVSQGAYYQQGNAAVSFQRQRVFVTPTLGVTGGSCYQQQTPTQVLGATGGQGYCQQQQVVQQQAFYQPQPTVIQQAAPTIYLQQAPPTVIQQAAPTVIQQPAQVVQPMNYALPVDNAGGAVCSGGCNGTCNGSPTAIRAVIQGGAYHGQTVTLRLR